MFDGFKMEDKTKRTQSQKQQIKFINDTENNQNTKENDWTCFNSYINPVEHKLKKEVHIFNKDDIEYLFENMETYSKDVKKVTFSLLKKYMDWAIDNKIRYDGNPMLYVDKPKCLYVDEESIKDKYISIEELFKRVEDAEIREINPQDIIIVLLSRYGVNGKDYSILRNLKWEDIDLSNRIIKIIDNETGQEKHKVKFDRRLEEWLMKTKSYKTNEEYINYESSYVITRDNSKEIVNTNYLTRRKNKIATELGLEKISLGNLARCKMIDDLTLMKDEKPLDSNSFKTVVRRYTEKISSMPCYNLKVFYTIITRDNDIERLSRAKKTIDEDDSEEEQEFPEGEETPKIHIDREREPKVINIAKSRFKNKYGRLFCEVCKFDFGNKYGSRGEDFIEGHHKIPVSQLKEGDTTKPEDIVLLCSNCHKMIHHTREFLTIEELEAIIRKNDISN